MNPEQFERLLKVVDTNFPWSNLWTAIGALGTLLVSWIALRKHKFLIKPHQPLEISRFENPLGFYVENNTVAPFSIFSGKLFYGKTEDEVFWLKTKKGIVLEQFEKKLIEFDTFFHNIHDNETKFSFSNIASCLKTTKEYETMNKKFVSRPKLIIFTSRGEYKLKINKKFWKSFQEKIIEPKRNGNLVKRGSKR